jgi:hypothetical protein
MKVPFTDLRAMHEEVREEIEIRWHQLVDGSAFVGGPAVQEFEQAFAEYCDVPYAVGVGSGTDALRIALQASACDRAISFLPCPTLSSRPWKQSRKLGRVRFLLTSRPGSTRWIQS